MSTSADLPSPPPLSHILETVLYVRDMPTAIKFYEETFQINSSKIMEIGAVFSIGTTSLLLFKLGATDNDYVNERGVIPKHGPTNTLRSSLNEGGANNNLRQHFCFAVDSPDAVRQWDERLQKLGVKISARMEWERGGRSVYFEDPDGHVGEIGSRGIWPHYPLV